MARSPATAACEACLRRTWLVSAVADHLARTSPTAAALDAALGLPDRELIDGLVPAARRRAGAGPPARGEVTARPRGARGPPRRAVPHRRGPSGGAAGGTGGRGG